jgi:hypothetical protein
MTQEYEFFKDFAGVTKSDLEMFRCGGKSKKKMQKGGTTPRNKNQVKYKQTDNYDEGTNLREFPNKNKNRPDSVVQYTGPRGQKTTRIINNGHYSKPVPNWVYEKGPNAQKQYENTKNKKKK